MAIEPESPIQQIEGSEQFLYRCPACGQMVDSRRREEMRAHHQHVLYRSASPEWFEHTSPVKPGRPSIPNPSGINQSQLSPGDNARSHSDQKHLRRYGHG